MHMVDSTDDGITQCYCISTVRTVLTLLSGAKSADSDPTGDGDRLAGEYCGGTGVLFGSTYRTHEARHVTY